MHAQSFQGDLAQKAAEAGAALRHDLAHMLPTASPASNQSLFTIHHSVYIEQLTMNSGLGILLSFLQTFFGALGKDFFRLAFTSDNRIYFVIGTISSIIIDPILNISALRFSTYAIVSACSAFAVFWNIILAPCILRERITRMRLIACGLIMLGTVWVGVFGPDHKSNYSGEQWLALLGSAHAVIYYVFLFAWIGFAYWRWRRAPSFEGRAWGSMLGGTLGGNTFPIEGALAIFSCQDNPPDSPAACYMGSPWLEWQLYLLGLLTLIAAGGSLLVLAMTLEHAEALDAVSIFTGVQIVFSALSANIVLNAAQTLTTVQFMFYAIGLAIILLGLMLLSIREMQWPCKVADEDLDWTVEYVDIGRRHALELWTRLQLGRQPREGGSSSSKEDTQQAGALADGLHDAEKASGGDTGPVESTPLVPPKWVNSPPKR